MAVQGVPYTLKSSSEYENDFGVPSNFNLSLRPPSDLSDQNIAAILECIGAEKRESGSVACSERGAIKYRRFQFIRSNGSSMTVIAPQRPNIVTQAECISKIINSTKHKIVCVKLFGEKHNNVLQDLRGDKTSGGGTGNPIKPPDDAGRNRYFYRGTIKAYKSDALYGGTFPMGFKMDSNADGEPYDSLQGEIEGCIGELIQANACGGSANSRDYRRFIVTLLTKPQSQTGTQSDQTSELSQSITIPVAEHLPDKIKECGTALANKTFTFCLGYEGESNDKLHKLFTKENIQNPQ